MVTPNKLYTVAEYELFLRQYPDRRFELIHGEIVEKVPTHEHGIIAAKIAARLVPFVEDNDLGYVAVEARYSPTGDDSNDRLPDVSVTLGAEIVTQGAVDRLPELAVEIKSPNDTYRHLRDKADYYLENGVQLVWLVYPEKRLVEVYALDGEIEILTVGDTLSGGTVLPDFEVAVSKLFP